LGIIGYSYAIISLCLSPKHMDRCPGCGTDIQWAPVLVERKPIPPSPLQRSHGPPACSVKWLCAVVPVASL